MLHLLCPQKRKEIDPEGLGVDPERLGVDPEGQRAA
jgi:hypothetical protein